MSENPHAERGITATIKFGSGAAPWLVFYGPVDVVRADIIKALGWDEERAANLSLTDLIAEASAEVQGMTVVQQELGGRIIDATERFGQVAESGGEDEDKGIKWLLEEVEKQSTIPALKELWARNKDAFAASEELTSAYMAKGKSLKAGG